MTETTESIRVCEYVLQAKTRPEYANHSCELKDGHKGKHKCSCGREFYSKVRFIRNV